MKINNSTSYRLKAFGWNKKHGQGEEVEIESGETKEILGPYLGEMGGRECHIHLGDDEIVCHEKPDAETGYCVSEGNYLILESNDNGITVFHHSENFGFVNPSS